ncbi:MAG: hypothetical protein H6555_13320, partial [Lewinellaceae bacterium]|nr:hypothetical protein [Lewinellaceae bacterium]
NSSVLTLNSLIPGDNYLQITVNGSPGCTGMVSVVIPDNSPTLSFSTVPRYCNGTNGKATATVNSGVGPYQYSWSSVQAPGTVIGTSSTLGPVAAGYYQLTLTDQGTGCTVVNTIGIPALSLLLQLTNPNPSVCDGKQVPVEVVASFSPMGYNPGGVINYVWYQNAGAIWVPVGGNTAVKILPDGDYKVVATHPSSGCTSELLFTVGLNPPMNVMLNINQPNCPGATASIEAITNGGSGIYSFSWAGVSNPPNSPVVSGVSAGNVSVTVSDNAGCAATATGTVVANGTPMSVVLPVVVQQCNLTVNLIGGVGPFLFEWTQQRPVIVYVSSGFGSSVIPQTVMQTFPVHEHQGDEPNTTSTATFPPGTGQYTLIVTDVFGCSFSTPVTLTIPDEPAFPPFSFVWSKVTPEYDPPKEPDPIVRENMAEAKNDLFNAFDRCVQSQQMAFKTDMTENCFNLEQFYDQTTLEYATTEGHYTLYYYDRAGRLSQTVPPEGVKPLNAAEVQSILSYRKGGGSVPNPILPDHHMRTTYAYNSLGQLVQQNTPDGGEAHFLYDNKSRLRFSQNARQQPLGAFSYTKYDELGRAVEAGESTAPGLDFANPSVAPNLTLANDQDFPASQLSQRTLTRYTAPAPVDYYGQPQRFLQNRVSEAYTDDDGDLATTADQYHTYYSYDVHGNVEWLIQEDPLIGNNYLWYDYDLISGNVLEVRYNEYRKDRLFHRYQYDSNNRLQLVETSTDGLIWERDATYKDYYLHGPLRRMELGEDKVQGLDYTYTIYGWLKAINRPGLDPADDPGDDGQGTSPNDVPTDAWGMSLGYYQGDFKRTGNSLSETEALYPGNGNTDARDLYNGNISHWTQSQLEDNGGSGYNVIKARAGIYHYDVLNRIKASMHYDQQGGANSWATRNNDYRTAYAYDANGNLETLQRFENNGLKMDELVYDYEDDVNGNRLHNRLLNVEDNETGNKDGRGDLEGKHEYTYDPTGNLIRDFGPERLDLGSGYQAYDVELLMDWTAYDKVRRVSKKIFQSGTATIVRREQLDFQYDASGNRARKTYAQDLNNNSSYEEDEITESYYVRDAQGNEMAFYRRINVPNGTLFTATLSLDEQLLYGSDQLGSLRRNLTIATTDYAAGDLPIFQTSEEGLARRSEYDHWITSANRTAPLCESRIASVTFDPQNNHQFTPESDLAVFLGTTRNGVAVAEDLQGALQFYVVLADGYLGNSSACLVFDRTGYLMDGAELPGVPDPDCKPVIVKLTGSAQYAVALLDGAGKPVYHVVDMAEPGFGTAAAPLGRVTQADLLLETAAPGATYGRHFSGYEDQLNGRTVVYHSRYTPDTQDPNQGQTEIRAYNFSSDPLLQPQAQTLYNAAGYGSTADGELQIGPEGDQLIWYQHNEQVAGFAHRTVQIHRIPLGADKVSLGGIATVRDASPAGNYGEGSTELHGDNAGLFYSQRGVYLENGTDKNVWYFKPTPTPTTLPLSSIGTSLLREVRRAADGRYYVPMLQAPAATLKAYDAAGASLGTEAIAPTIHALASSLPVQVYKFGPIQGDGVYSRRLGMRKYWLKDHLSSVRVTVGDEKSLVNGELRADLEGWSDYYPFGMGMSGRVIGGDRFGFNGQERSNQITENGNHYTAEFWEYDSRLGKRWNKDPLYIPQESFFATFRNNPIYFNDPLGDCPDCPDPSTAKEGDIINPNGEREYIMSGGNWFGLGGLLPEVNISANGKGGGIPFEQMSSEMTEASYGGSFMQYKIEMGLPLNYSWYQAEEWSEKALEDWNISNGYPKDLPYEGAYRKWYETTDFYKRDQAIKAYPIWLFATIYIAQMQVYTLGGQAGVSFPGLGLNPTLATPNGFGFVSRIQAPTGLFQGEKVSGSYLLEFQSGKFYAGKGLEPRMMQSINRIETTYGDKLFNSQFFPASSTRGAFINEHNLMMQFGGPKSFNPLSPTYNKIFSPGRKLVGF